MNELTIRELHQLAADALVGQGFPPEHAHEVSREFVAAEVAGVRTHGVAKIASMNLGDLTSKPSIERAGVVLRVDGRGSSGLLLMREVVRECAAIAEDLGLAAASVRNFSRYSSLYPYTEMLAENGLVGILMNSAGPPAVAPFGGADAVTGTNPVCFSFPTAQGIHTIDLATSEMVWGEIRQAAIEGRQLAHGPFLDAAGAVTTAPGEARAVRAFGGPRGSAINLMIEVLAGLLTGASAGLAVSSEYDCGALLMVMKPAAFGAGAGLPHLISDLLADVRASRPLPEHGPVRAPGDRGRSRIDIGSIGSRVVEVPATVVSLLCRMAEGQRISELSGNPRFN